MINSVIVADSSPLISLSIIEQLEILPQLYQQILIPPAVWDEVTVQGVGLPGSQAVSQLTWLEIQTPEAQFLKTIQQIGYYCVLCRHVDVPFFLSKLCSGCDPSGKLLDTKAKGLSQLKPGTLLQERNRSIPENVTLKIGLDDTLDSSTTQQAKQALQSIKRFEAVPLRTSEVQYIFGHMTEAKYQELQKTKISNLPPVGSFGLFLPAQDKILPGSFGESNETVSAAVTRLRPKLKSLLAARVVKQMLGNTNTSRIAVNASMTVAGSKKILSEIFPSRGLDKVSSAKPVANSVNSLSGDVPKLSVGTQIAFQIRNDESMPVYITLLVIDSSGEMTVIFPNDWAAAKDATLLNAGQRLIVPQAGVDNFVLTIGEPLRFAEALIIASTTPLRDSLKALKEVATSRGVRGKHSVVSVADDEVLNITSSLLDDLDRGTRGAIVAEDITLPQGVRGIDTNKLAAMTIGFEVVAKS